MTPHATASGSKDVWAVGTTLSNFSSNQTLALHWDGTAWSIVASPNPSPGFNNRAGVGGTAAGQPLWAVGSQIPSSIYRTLIVTATARVAVSAPFRGRAQHRDLGR
jgi:hypothetical protein